jgi:ubiquitin carboxyl-terminal hydrolase 4/11/15
MASADSSQSRAAYLLFYRRRTTRPIGGLSRVKAEEASRAASPAPSSPEAGPSHPLSRRSSGSTSSTDPIPSTDGRQVPRWSPIAQPEADDNLPPYIDEVTTPPTPEPASPTMSNDSDEFPRRSTDFSGVASQIGFGNNVSWGSSATTPSAQHSFGISSVTAPTALPSPPDSDDGFERLRKQPAVALAPPIGQSTEEDYEEVEREARDGDTEMTSPSNPLV